MPRKPLIRSDRFPYHVIARSNNRDWFQLPGKEIWNIFTQIIANAQTHFEVKIHAFVLMSNHFHCVLTTPNANLDNFMHYFLRESAKEINSRTERIDHLFGAPYKWSLITNRFHFEQVMRYVFQNPLKAGIADRVENFPFSTIYFQNKNKSLDFEVTKSIFEEQNLFDYPIWHKLDWLNEKYTPEQRETIRRALYHPITKFRKSGPRSKLYLTPTM